MKTSPYFCVKAVKLTAVLVTMKTMPMMHRYTAAIMPVLTLKYTSVGLVQIPLGCEFVGGGEDA